MPTETADQRAARYERALRAIGASKLVGPNFGDWVQQTVEEVLDGFEAECPNCEAAVHDGPCVGESDA
jgi:hypothetical protein